MVRHQPAQGHISVYGVAINVFIAAFLIVAVEMSVDKYLQSLNWFMIWTWLAMCLLTLVVLMVLSLSLSSHLWNGLKSTIASISAVDIMEGYSDLARNLLQKHPSMGLEEESLALVLFALAQLNVYKVPHTLGSVNLLNLDMVANTNDLPRYAISKAKGDINGKYKKYPLLAIIAFASAENQNLFDTAVVQSACYGSPYMAENYAKMVGNLSEKHHHLMFIAASILHIAILPSFAEIVSTARAWDVPDMQMLNVSKPNRYEWIKVLSVYGKTAFCAMVLVDTLKPYLFFTNRPQQLITDFTDENVSGMGKCGFVQKALRKMEKNFNDEPFKMNVARVYRTLHVLLILNQDNDWVPDIIDSYKQGVMNEAQVVYALQLECHRQKQGPLRIVIQNRVIKEITALNLGIMLQMMTGIQVAFDFSKTFGVNLREANAKASPPVYLQEGRDV